jgi:hypothetical protein
VTKSLIRFVVPCLAAALMLGAVTAASASAEACTKKAGSSVALCIEGQKNEESVRANLTQASTSATLELPRAWPHMEWVCSKVSVEHAEFSSTGNGSGGKSIGLTFTPTWSGCTTKYSESNKKCVMPEEQQFYSQPGIIATSAGKDVIDSADLVEFILENRSPTELCQTIRGYHHVGGVYECTLQEPEVEASQHELICESTGGNETRTRLEEKPVWLKYALNVELGYEGKKFSIYGY